MSFITFGFALFFISVFFIYWFLKKFDLRIQNGFLLVASYFFYAFWSWKFLLLLFTVSLVNYFFALAMSASNEGKVNRKFILIMGLVINIGNLFFFKYFNFFIEEFVALISLFGIVLNTISLTLIIPLGISFYTFLSVSYLVDVYRRRIVAEKNLLHMLLTLSFFPIIFSGPIQRPALLLPQINTPRTFNYPDMTAGLRQILWGLFTKLVIADNLAPVVNEIFSKGGNQDGASVILGILFFTVQVYADFAGYSDMAIGFARLLGFNLMRNFEYPYFARNIGEFWKKWHVSLTTWFRDYLFLPIVYAVSKRIKSEKVLHIKSDYLLYAIGISITWFMTGIWHGANNTFLVWGLIHGTALILYQIQKKTRKRFLVFMEIRHDNKVLMLSEWILTMLIVMFSWTFFRTKDTQTALVMLGKVNFGALLNFPELFFDQIINVTLIGLFFILEWNGRNCRFAIEKIGFKWPLVIRWSFYGLIISMLFLFAQATSSEFLYSKF